MFSPEVSSPRLHILKLLETELLQDIRSCIAGDVLVELKKKTEITRWSKEAQVMINYEEILVVVLYHTNIEGLFQLDG